MLERERHPEALAWVGWILHLSGEPESASNFLEEALELEPDYPQAQWWLANVRFEGLGDPTGAIAPLEQLLSYTDVPDDIRAAAVELLAAARAS